MLVEKIGVIGVGKLGLAFSLLCEKNGLVVYASDNNKEYIDSLRNGTHKTTEPYIESWLDECGQFHPIYSNREVVENTDIIYLFVPTPSLPTGEYDHQYIEQALESIIDMDLTDKILVIGCTVMPGYTQTLIDRFADKKRITIVYNPEFIAQGEIVKGLQNADMILIGTHSKVVHKILGDIYKTIMGKELNMNVMSPTAAEITKISINCFLTMKIAYANMIGDIIINSGIQQEVSTVLKAIGSDSRIGHKYLNYGFGFGGVCLPRDNKALRSHADSIGTQKVLSEAIDESNDYHAYFLINYYIKQNPDKTLPFIFTQLTYKKGVELLVESQQYRLCRDLLEAGYSVAIQESNNVIKIVKEELKQHLDRITFGEVINGYKIDL